MNKKMNQMSPQEKQWQAEDDARTLKAHAKLQNDPSRVSEAQKIIQNELSCLQQVAGSVGSVNTQKKTTTNLPKSDSKKKTSTTGKAKAPAMPKVRMDNVTATTRARQAKASKKRGK